MAAFGRFSEDWLARLDRRRAKGLTLMAERSKLSSR
jgi:hypothetical protein